MSAPRKRSTVRFKEPPPVREQRYDWEKIAAKLRKNPGEWAEIFQNDVTSLATAIRIRGIKALHPDKGFEVRTTNNKKGSPRTCDLWLRYNPERDKHKED